ncbi:nuclear protein [Pholiota conissans]|uniref:Nuclear protein n=1 Tax=Pholiota conissans TaxID=109636 RepID=A0A9P5ZAA1_9AGAR|nr:nuclear protein [Pholiota conissans]
MAAASIKVLTVGSAVGSISDLFTKIKAIDAKHGKFDLVLCIGDFFGPLNDTENEPHKDDEILKLLDGRLEAPIECYVMQGEHPLPKPVVEKFAKTGGELGKNLFMMSKSGIVTTANGVRIACLGGIYDPSVYGTAGAAPGFFSPFFSYHTIDRLLSNTLVKASTSSQKSYSSLASIQASAAPSQLIDILLTNVWPISITQFSSTPLPDHRLSSIGAPPLSDVIRKTKPRYHFAARGGHPPKFWEREPFTWDDERERVSRFWFYAFTIAPNTAMTEPPVRPPNATKNPFLDTAPRAHKRPLDNMEASENFIFGNVQQPVKRSRVVQGEPGKPPSGYKCRRCDSTEPGHFVRDCPTKDAKGDTGGRKPKPGYLCRACGSDGHYLEDCLVANQRPPQSDRRGKRGPPKEISTDECWFCLSNPNLAKHLIVAIGSECYVTLPKGQIIPTQSFADHVDVPGGGHVLIVPITHYPTYSTIPSDLAPPIVEETEQFQKALSAMYAKYGAAAVAFEVGRLSAKGGHAHVQSVPIPLRLKDKVEEAFIHEGRALGIDFEADPEAALDSCSNGRGSYFKVELPDGRKMVHLLKDSVPFSIQFGR